MPARTAAFRIASARMLNSRSLEMEVLTSPNRKVRGVRFIQRYNITPPCLKRHRASKTTDAPPNLTVDLSVTGFLSPVLEQAPPQKPRWGEVNVRTDEFLITSKLGTVAQSISHACYVET